MVKKLGHTFLSKGIVALINFYILLISSRYLGVESRGEISIFLLNIAVIQLVAEIYTGYSLVHFLAKYNLQKIFRDGLLVIILVAIAGTFTAFLLNRQVTPNLNRAIIVTILVLLHTFTMIVLLGLQQIRIYNILSVLQPAILALTLTGIIFLKKEFTFNAYYTSLFISFVIALLFSGTRLLFAQKTKQNDYQFTSVVKKGLLFQTSLLMFIFINRYNYYVLQDHKIVGIYNVACTIMEAVLLIAYSAGTLTLAHTSNNKNQHSNSTFVYAMARISMIGTTMALFLILCLPDLFFVKILGPSYAGIKSIMFFYAPAVFFQSLLLVFSNYLTALGQQRSVLQAYWPAFAVVLFCSPFFVNVMGVNGAAVSAVIGFSVALAHMLWKVQKTTGLSYHELLKFWAIKSDLNLIDR